MQPLLHPISLAVVHGSHPVFAAKAVRAAGALRMNPPATIDTLFNRIARREALPASPIVDFDMALPPLEFQVEARFLRKTIFRFLAPAASSNFPPPLGIFDFGAEADTICGSARTPAAFSAAAASLTR